MIPELARASAQPASPSPTQTQITNLAFDNNTQDTDPQADPDLALGTDWAIVKANRQIMFLQRNSDGSLPASGTLMDDSAFWGTSVTDVSAGTGTATVTAVLGDGRVYYDPYGPTGSGCTAGGRFIFTELANFKDAGGVDRGGALLAISNGGDPSNAANWSKCALYDTTATCDSQGLCPGDQPRPGFNTNWIVVWVDQENGSPTSNSNADLFVVPCNTAERSGITGTATVFAGLPNTVAPAVTYQSNGLDPDGATLYFVGRDSPSGAKISVYELTGTPTSPAFNPPFNGSTLTPLYTPSAPLYGGWSQTLPDVKQDGGTQIIPAISTIGSQAWWFATARSGPLKRSGFRRRARARQRFNGGG